MMTRRTLLQSLTAVAIPNFVPFPMLLSNKEGVKSLPTSELNPIPLENVVVDDSFWKPKLKLWRTRTIRDCLAKFEGWQSGVFKNFDRVRDGKTGGHAGLPWFDGLIYQTIRAAGDFLRSERDAALESEIDSLIARIVAAAAKSPDGYLNTYTQLMEPGHEWGLNGGLEVWQHEFYNAGALVDAGVHYYRGTKKTALLQAGIKLANTMCNLVRDEVGKNLVPSHQLPEEALLGLYELLVEVPSLQASLTGASNPKQYLQLAEFWIEQRGKNTVAIDWSNRDRAGDQVRAFKDYSKGRPSWGDYAQDRIPILNQTEIVGHAVRSTLLCSALVAVGRANGKPQYLASATKLWENMTWKRMHITGGVGAMANEEAFGDDYQLPNNAYLETCASVGAGFFHANMHRVTGSSRYADELERVMFNGVLCGISLSGDHYTYQNPLILDESRVRWSWHDCPCCPPMFLKFMAALPSTIYSQDSSSVYINQFIGSRASITVAGKSITLTQTTQYPWSGKVRIAVDVSEPTEFTLKIRVPSWCEKHSLKSNSGKLAEAKKEDGYIELKRVFKAGDSVEIDFEMPVKTVKAHPKVTENQGNIALTRGPLVYCFESFDNAKSDLQVEENAKFSLETWEDRLGNVVVIETSSEANPLVAIPFYATGNRGPVKMQVWVPTSS